MQPKNREKIMQLIRSQDPESRNLGFLLAKSQNLYSEIWDYEFWPIVYFLAKFGKSLPPKNGFVEKVRAYLQLSRLSLLRKKIKELPDKIGNLSGLQGLDLRGNEIKALPESIANIPRLHLLYVDEITFIPDSIRAIKGISIITE